MKKLSLFLVLLTLMTSCSSNLDKKYNEATFAEDLKTIKDSEKLSDDDLAALALYPTAVKLRGESMKDGITYRAILDSAKRIIEQRKLKEKEEELLAEKAKKEEAERIERLGKALTVAVFDKGFQEVDYQNYITLQFAFENKTDKEIRAFKGVMVFADIFGQEIKSINLTYDQPIKPMGSRKWDATVDYNQFSDEDKLLASKELKDLKVTWHPEEIMFSDGSALK